MLVVSSSYLHNSGFVYDLLLMLGSGPHQANQDAVTLQNKTMTTAFPKMK